MKNIKNFSINIEAVIKIATLLGYALLFYMVIISGNAKYYVHPRIVPYMVFGILVFILISYFISDELLRPKRQRNAIWRYVFFIIPLILAFSIPPKNLEVDSISLSGNYIRDNSHKEAEHYSSQGSNGTNESENYNDYDDKNDDNVPSETPSPNGLVMNNNTVIMKSENFIPWIEELYNNLVRYEGKNIEVVGFVFRDKEFNPSEFVPARFTMSCCAADMQPVGILCNYEGTVNLKKDSWVKVTGKILRGEYKGQIMPYIDAETVEPAQKPENEIVY
ncbi:TIGR03943 family putative permease subunit [Pseudobacteroides cellulosolvens]|uniref:TIGR03943 family protein n=1 Tax=Pseudobacteroides cellulosolvens ATCC 35603 = DSM 2933 TaxID=398512 RepID=A0A0L6JI17_9FIRM|nr:TIGR03943 family protein [Pseudobacteroides cellulosolvens]KNY25355.1 protein of unknown function DUF1980 [Pseudobacteroides cellulosolvens ATCC 35603 = DSM 2933]